ncbi:hypothetical protein LCGC14_0667270 [marine sediment metagenome]|uniref:Uncharacterized protein n=1 Tax=marine sediment metagenome TaxID=412755 RepID=A0A0F9RC22_9ZZZZ
MLTRRKQIAAAVEGTEGSPETLTAAEAKFLAYDPKVTFDVPAFKRNPVRATLSRMASVMGVQPAKITFGLELRGSGTAGTAPAWTIFLRACGFGETPDPGNIVTWVPASSSIPSLTIACYHDGVIKTMVGCRGTVKFVHKVGEPVMMEFEFTGVYYSWADGALLSGISFESTVPPKFQNASLLMHSYAAIISALEFDMANTVSLRDDSNSSGGLLSAVIVERNPVGTFDPEAVLNATHDFMAKLIAGTLAAFTETIGSEAGNYFVITAPKVQYIKIDEGDRNGIATDDIGFELSLNTGDDEFSIVQH